MKRRSDTFGRPFRILPNGPFGERGDTRAVRPSENPALLPSDRDGLDGRSGQGRNNGPNNGSHGGSHDGPDNGLPTDRAGSFGGRRAVATPPPAAGVRRFLSGLPALRAKRGAGDGNVPARSAGTGTGAGRFAAGRPGAGGYGGTATRGRETTGVRRLIARLSFGTGARVRAWKKVGRQMKLARLPMERCFQLLAERAEADRNPVAWVHRDMHRALCEGKSAAEAMAPWSTAEEVMLVDAGQTAGEAALATGFLRAADLLERRRELTGTVLKELSYPLFLLCAVAAFLVVISSMVVPRLAVLSDPAGWRGASALLRDVSFFVASWKGAATAAGLVLLTLLCLLSLPRWTGRARDLADRLPPFSIYRVLTGVSWLQATATLLEARDMKLGTVLRRLLESPDTSPYLKWRLLPVALADSQGRTLGEALHSTKSKWPDPEMVDDLRTYSTLPGFASLLGGMAEELTLSTVDRVRRGARVFGALSLCGIVVLLILLVMGIFGIQDQITREVGAVGGL